MPPKKKFRYDDSFIQFGFIVIKSGGEEKPQCVLCNNVLASSSLKPCKLKRHLETNHSSLQHKGVDFFKRHGENLKKSRLDDTGMFFKEIAAGLKASYEVSREIAIAKKPHTIGEQLILPCCKIIMSNLLGNSELEKLKQVSLSDNSVSRRIADMSNNILLQVVSKMHNSNFKFFSIQLDETTDVANLAQLCVYVRYVHEKHSEDEFLFCEPLDTTTKAKDIFNKVDSFFRTHDLRWEHVIGVCTDGAPAMLGCRSGFQTLVKEKSPNAIGTHCILHRQALMVKTMPDKLSCVLTTVIKAVNFIKANALNSRLFQELCKESDSAFQNLLLYTHVRWLSKGKVLKRVFLLRKEIQEFLRERKPELHNNFSDNSFLILLAFLVDIFESVNRVNLGLQGKEINALHSHEKLTAFNTKIGLWGSKLEKKNFAPFPELNQFLDDNELEASDDIIEVMKQHVSILSEEISHYFPNLQEVDKLNLFINKPFTLKLDDLPSESNEIQEEFIDMINDGGAKLLHREMCCTDFWIEMGQSYPNLSKMALKFLLPFVTTYECEAAFSTLLNMKNKYRNRLDVVHDMRVALSKTKPNIDDIIAAKQVHPSHYAYRI